MRLSCRDPSREAHDEPSRLCTKNAQNQFPRGLEQPEGSFRFSMDALLLAAFAGQHLTAQPSAIPAFDEQHLTANPSISGMSAVSAHKLTFLDLGTGCGVVAFALLLLAQHHLKSLPQGRGLDLDPNLLAAASRNAVQLGLEKHVTFTQGDVTDTIFLKKVRQQHGPVDLILANPPWRSEHSGRTPTAPARRRALFEDGTALHSFTRAASVLMTERGRFVSILGASRLPDLFEAFAEVRLRPVRLCLVHKQVHSPAKLCLLEARRKPSSGQPASLCVEAPLVLYDRDHNPTAEAQAFCPFL